MRSRGAPAERGFTLVEVLVAMLVFAVFGAMAYGGLRSVMRQSEIVELHTDRLREVQYAMRTLASDLEQLDPRPVRDRVGDARQPSLQAGSRSEFPLELTRAGWSNPLGAPRGTLQRVSYFLEDDKLVRLQWLSLDRTLADEPLRQELLTGVTAFTIRFLDTDRQWHDEWPPEAQVDPEQRLRWQPIAAEVHVELEDWGELLRLLELTG